MDKIFIENVSTEDVRFPTSLEKDGSDAMNKSPDHSSAYVIVRTSSDKLTGYASVFTNGRGNDMVCRAIQELANCIVGNSLAALTENMSETWRLVDSGQIRWLGPDTGVLHMAKGAIMNAILDLWARSADKPVWKLVCDLPPETLVGFIPFDYIKDALTPEEALTMLKDGQVGKDLRIQQALDNKAVLAYTTSAGWLGYSDEKMRIELKKSIADGFTHFKFKVGRSFEENIRKLEIARSVFDDDPKYKIMVDANQVWGVHEAIDHMKRLAKYKPWFIEEPTSPHDIRGHRAIRNALKSDGIGVATGEHCQNMVMWKQFFQERAIDYAQIDACRLAGFNEVLAVLLLAKKFGVPVIPHSGGVGLPEYVQHVAAINFIIISGTCSHLEYVGHLHEHFLHPADVHDSYYITPLKPGYSIEMLYSSIQKYKYPNGIYWASEEGKKHSARVSKGL